MSFRDRIQELRRVRAGDLIPHPKNWRTHDDQQRTALNAMLEEVGFAGAVIVRPHNGGFQIIDGHLRSGMDPDAEVPVLVTDLDESEAEKLLATYDPIGAMAGVDAVNLRDLLDSIQTESEAVGDLLKHVEFQARLDNGAEKPPRDALPEELPDPIAARGDLWALGRHRLLCGDSTDPRSFERLMVDSSPAALFATDPPYVVGYTGGRMSRSTGGNVGKDWSRVYKEIEITDAPGFYGAFTKACMPHVRDDAAWYLWHGHKWAGMIMDLWQEVGVLPHQQIVWVKPAPMFSTAYFNWRHETCLFGWKEGHKPDWASIDEAAKTTSVWELTYDGGLGKHSADHPTQKPVEVFAIPMRIHTRPGDVCLEPFSGSGSQLIAAETEGRVCRAVELEPRFVDVAIARWEALTGKKAELIDNQA